MSYSTHPIEKIERKWNLLDLHLVCRKGEEFVCERVAGPLFSIQTNLRLGKKEREGRNATYQPCVLSPAGD